MARLVTLVDQRPQLFIIRGVFDPEVAVLFDQPENLLDVHCIEEIQRMRRNEMGAPYGYDYSLKASISVLSRTPLPIAESVRD